MMRQNHWLLRKLLNSVFLWGRENCYLALRFRHRVRVFENRAERKIFGPKIEVGIEGWKKNW